MNKTKSVFYFLCIEKRQSAYQLITSDIGYEVIYVDTLEDLLRKCIDEPPRGVFIDILTSLRFGATNIMPIDNLAMSWPIMRCNITSNGSTLVLCMDTPKRDTLPNALKSLFKNEEGWNNPLHKRTFIRMGIHFRIRIRPAGTDTWTLANGRNIATDGAFIHTYDEFQPRTDIDVEISDLTDKPLVCKGRVMWKRTWDESTALPGIGVQFYSDTVQMQLKKILSTPENIRLFLSGKYQC